MASQAVAAIQAALHADSKPAGPGKQQRQLHMAVPNVVDGSSFLWIILLIHSFLKLTAESTSVNVSGAWNAAFKFHFIFWYIISIEFPLLLTMSSTLSLSFPI